MCYYYCMIRYWDLCTGKCLHVGRKFPCSLEPNCQILSCDSVQLKDRWLVSVGTYDGGLYVFV